MKSLFSVMFLLLTNLSNAASLSQCVNFCEQQQTTCMRECSCHSNHRMTCNNNCSVSLTKCQTACKLSYQKQIQELPVTHLPGLTTCFLGKQCLAPKINSNYAYW